MHLVSLVQINFERTMNSRHGNRTFILVFFVIGIFSSFQVQALVREHWIAAEKISWDYAPSARNQIDPDAGLEVWGEYSEVHKISLYRLHRQ